MAALFWPLGYDTIIVGYDSVFHFNLIRRGADDFLDRA